MLGHWAQGSPRWLPIPTVGAASLTGCTGSHLLGVMMGVGWGGREPIGGQGSEQTEVGKTIWQGEIQGGFQDLESFYD